MRRFRHLLLLLFTAGLMLPVLALLGVWLPWGARDGQAAQILTEMAHTVLPDYALTSLWLCLLVAAGVIVIGLSSAVAVTLFDFAGRRVFEWALLLPLAMPAYVVAYAYTDFLQYSGPLQTWLRSTTGLQGRLFPEIRNVAGAAWVLTFALYPYVYLLARTALGERAAHLMEAARLLGAPLSRRIREVALPLARPAVVTVALLTFITSWNQFQWPLIMTTSHSVQPIEIALSHYMQTFEANWRKLTSAVLLALAPIVIVFLLLQRYIVDGVAGRDSGVNA